MDRQMFCSEASNVHVIERLENQREKFLGIPKNILK
jgi:hypothetical protein